MVDLKKSANALFLEHYGGLLRSGLLPSEALGQAKKDWLQAIEEFNGFTLEDHARSLFALVDQEGRRLHKESVTKNVERITVLKGLRLALVEVLEMEEKKHE
ncbi:hypothetical protein C0431_12860 [bacterium]|nr:hypothetical protein [bacterium]